MLVSKKYLTAIHSNAFLVLVGRCPIDEEASGEIEADMNSSYRV